METQERMEREINLLELFWNILLGWRQIICFGLLFAVLLGSVKYVRDTRAYQAAQNMDQEQTEEALTEEELEQVAEAKELIAQMAEYENYMEESAWMQIDPYREARLTLQYYVKSDYVINYTRDNVRDYTGDVINAYSNYAASGEMSSEIIKEAGLSISQEDFSELRSVDMDNTTLVITIAYPKEEQLESIGESVKKQISKKESEIQQIGAHQLILLGESQDFVVDKDLIDRKGVIFDTITRLQNQLNNLKTNMTEPQLNLLKNDKEEDSEEKEENLIPTPGFSVKYAVLGAIFGVFLVCIWIVCKMLFTARLQNSEEIRSLYGMRLLGEIEVPSKQSRFLPGVDAKLLAVKDRRRKKLSPDQQIKMVSANIALSCKQQGMDHIYLTGSEYEKADKNVLESLKQELMAQGVQIQEGGNIFYDAESLKQGTAIGNLLFVEQIGQSIYDEISNELNLAREQKSNILGIVVFV
ncbi:MAG: hypothetical protein HFH41_06015 [Lachnospiraceae bacterium]|nr:hypothetical protein [Lachnospiraceae bacterium]